MDFSPYLGLTRSPSDCDGSKPENVINDVPGKTLLYLDDIPELPLARLSGVAGWSQRDEARTMASVVLNADLKAFLGGSFQARPLYSGRLGKDSYTQFPIMPSQTVSTPFQMRYLNGGELLIRSLGLILSGAVTNQVIGLYREGTDEPLKTQTIPRIEARSLNQTSLPEAWRLPMDGNRYELRTTLPEGIKVADNPLACGGCGGMGALMSMITNCCSGRANGFLLTLGGACSYDPLLLQLMENDRSRLVIAYMLAYQAGYILCSQTPSSQIERATVLSETDISSAASLCKTEYLNRLGWLKSEAPKLGLSAENTCFQTSVPYSWSRSNGAFR